MVDSQSGKITRQTNPMTIIAMILALFHPSNALDAMVSGIKMSVNPALRNTIPPMSSSKQRFFMVLEKLRPAH